MMCFVIHASSQFTTLHKRDLITHFGLIWKESEDTNGRVVSLDLGKPIVTKQLHFVTI